MRLAALSLLMLLTLIVKAVAQDRLTVEHDGVATEFSVEIADTPAARSQGLMFRSSLAPRSGMLFVFDEVRVATFWMRNTPLPLDMIFIAPDGRIVRIEPMTKPYSEDVIPSGEPVLGVLEIRGGEAAELGIEAGDRVRHPAFE